MLKNKSLITLSLMLGICLSSCSMFDAEYKPYQYDYEKINTKYELTAANYYKLREYKPFYYKDLADLSITHEITKFRQLYSSSNNGRLFLNMDSIGEQNVLILPVSFSDSNKDNLANKKKHIQNAFFGEPSTTVHESVASYFDKVSFGNLKIKGEVADFYHVNYYAKDFKNSKVGAYEISQYITCLATDFYRKNNPDKIKDFDNDKDGYLDGVITVYDYPYYEEKDASNPDNFNKTLFWAYIDHMREKQKTKEGQIYNDVAPYVSTYGWMSYDFLNVNNNKVDAHVFIHEMGHVLGLQDYYSKGKYQPLGFMDMMDYNLGDHNLFSKMLLNWTTPYVVKGNCEITLKPSYKSGDGILIPSGDWNGTPYDEFILLEFYAPEGVNYHDSRLSFRYQNGSGEIKEGKLFTEYGVKAYHVDSRVGYIENKLINGDPIALVDDPDLEKKQAEYKKSCYTPTSEGGRGYNYVKYCIDFPYTNAYASHPYIKLLEKGETNYLKNYNAAENSTLFIKGDEMGINSFKSFKFYDGSSLPFSFEIKDLTPDHVTIKFAEI